MEVRLRIGELLDLLEAWAPLELAESWDASGLQVGDPLKELRGIYLCLDVTPETVEEAIRKDANLILSHHPLLFKSLRSIDINSIVGKIIHRCLTEGVSVYSIHTNMDKAKGGMNDYAAERMGLGAVAPLFPATEVQGGYKLVTFVPQTHKEKVVQALFEAGGGKIGVYEGCSFSTEGEGTFYAGEETHPFIGERGRLNRVPEVRVEVLFSSKTIEQGIKAMKQAHPYEVPAYDAYPLARFEAVEGFGRVGSYSPPLPWEEFLERLCEAFKTERFRVVGMPRSTVKNVAVCTGSGASLIEKVVHRADVYVTGDVKYHEAQEAVSLGVTVVDVGHYALEKIFGPLMVRWLNEKGISSPMIFESTVEKDPFTFYHKGEIF